MKNAPDYPFSFGLIASEPKLCAGYFTSRRWRGRSFIGLCELDGAALCEDPARVFAALEQGERLELSPRIVKGKSKPPLIVAGSGGGEVGYIPFAASLLPLALIVRGADVFCLVEAKTMQKGVPEIAVSLWCGKY